LGFQDTASFADELRFMTRKSSDSTTNVYVDQVRVLDYNPTPEPGTLAIAGLGLAGLAWRRLRKRKG
jgi:hypothetical protein